jgi:hypothetical protein
MVSLLLIGNENIAKRVCRGNWKLSMKRVTAQLFVHRTSISGSLCDEAGLCSRHICDRSMSCVSSVLRGTVNVLPESEFWSINLP